MMREYRFDVVRVVCMTYLVAYFHLYGYVYPQGGDAVSQPVRMAMAHACLGLFTFVSGYLLGRKYSFGQQGNAGLWTFYKKRILRVFPLFVVASLALWLIGFNGGRATLNGLLCISPFVDPKPGTMYYIPLILWCYLVTPLIARRGLGWRVGASLSVFLLLLVARFLFPSIDSRFVFNVFFYLVGLVSASCFDWSFRQPWGSVVKTVAVLAFGLLVAVAVRRSLLSGYAAQMLAGALGVFVVLFVCEGISRLGGRRLVSMVSYASMACYLFHRFFYWAAENVWNPADPSVKWLYMAGIVFPVILLLSYAIQKLYDRFLSSASR